MHVAVRAIMGLSLLGAVCFSSGCAREGTSRNDVEVAFDPESRAIDFGSVPVGHSRTRVLGVWNRSKVDLTFTASVGAPFLTDEEGALPGGARHDITLTFQPGSVGPAEAEVTLVIDAQEYPVRVRGIGAEACASTSPCHSSTFDENDGTCHDSVVADGTACEAPCIENGACAAGVCVGAAGDCDDHDVCTKDACTAGKGCVHSEISCAPSEDPCRV